MKKQVMALSVVTMALWLAAGTARAVDGSWLGNSGNWSDMSPSGVWSGGTVADGTNFTAYFTGINITAAKTVTNDTARTIGNITFTDTTPDNNLTIATGAALNLAVTSGSPVIDVTQSGRTLTLGCVIAGTNGLTKSGAGTLTLSGTSSYSGATIINGGTLDVSGLGQNPLSSSSGLVITGTSTFIYTGAQPDYALPSTTVSSGVTANFKNTSNGNNTRYTMASLSGAGKFSVDNPGGSGQGKGITFGDMSSFTGVLEYNLTGASLFFSTPNLNDTVANNIRVLGSGTTTPMQFIYTGSSALTLTNRAFEWGGAAGCNFTINSSGTGAFIINKDLLVTAAGAKTLQLGGSNTGNNTFAGAITNGSSAVITLIKADSGTWILSGSNTYSGPTTINAGGTLEISGGGCLGAGGVYSGNIANSGTFRYRSSCATQTWTGVISGIGTLLQGGLGTLKLAGVNTYSGATTVTNGVLLGVTGGSCSNSSFTVTNTPGVTAALGVLVTNNTMQWTCSNLTFKVNGVGAELKFSFAVEPSTSVAPLNITSNLIFTNSVAPLVVVDSAYLSAGTYPLVIVGGTAPTSVVPELSMPSQPCRLGWTGNTLSLTIMPPGMIITIK